MLGTQHKKMDHTPKGKVKILSNEIDVPAMCGMFAKKSHIPLLSNYLGFFFKLSLLKIL